MIRHARQDSGSSAANVLTRLGVIEIICKFSAIASWNDPLTYLSRLDAVQDQDL